MAAIRAMQALVQGTRLAALLVAARGARWALVRACGAGAVPGGGAGSPAEN